VRAKRLHLETNEPNLIYNEVRAKRLHLETNETICTFAQIYFNHV